MSVALTVAVTWRSPALASAALGSWSLMVAVSLTDRSQALATLGLAVAAAVGCAWRARQSLVRAGAAFGAVLGLGAFGQVLAEATGLRPWITVLAVLGIAALAQVTAWRLYDQALHRPGPPQIPSPQVLSPQVLSPQALSPQVPSSPDPSPQVPSPYVQ